MKILVVNCGSSSVKCQLFEMAPERVVARVRVENLGASDTFVSYEDADGRCRRFDAEISDHQTALETVLELLGHPEVDGVGHRIVHGGERLTASMAMTDEVLEAIHDCIELAPLHNPAHLRGYHAAEALLPGATHVAVFDTAFHQTIPPEAYVYGLPYDFYTQYKIRRYGFHGTSHRYVSGRYAELAGRRLEDCRVITCHLGNGCSICAIDHGRSVDTSMGFTPLEGLLMGTRSGDIDPAAVFFLMLHEGLGAQEAEALLNWRSGLLGISGISNDMRTLLDHCRAGAPRARLAVDAFCYRIKKYIGAYYAVLDGCDAVIFTGGIGENAAEVRTQCCRSLEALGIGIDAEKNAAARAVEADISAPGARTRVWVVPTNEELLIARDTAEVIRELR
jgi:acetate kinase